jgi:hypothetical protein
VRNPRSCEALKSIAALSIKALARTSVAFAIWTRLCATCAVRFEDVATTSSVRSRTIVRQIALMHCSTTKIAGSLERPGHGVAAITSCTGNTCDARKDEYYTHTHQN